MVILAWILRFPLRRSGLLRGQLLLAVGRLDLRQLRVEAGFRRRLAIFLPEVPSPGKQGGRNVLRT